MHSKGLEDYTKNFNNPPLRGAGISNREAQEKSRPGDGSHRPDLHLESEVQLEERRMIQTYMRDKKNGGGSNC